MHFLNTFDTTSAILNGCGAWRDPIPPRKRPQFYGDKKKMIDNATQK